MVDVPETRFARTGEGRCVAYQAVGSGSPDILLFPTVSAIDVVWDEPSYAAFLRRLATLGRLILFDPSGLGASDPVPLGALPTPEAWTEDLTLVLDAVGSTRAHIIGHGNAGSLAMLFAAIHPTRTKSLTLIDPTARVVEDEGYACGIPAQALERFLAWSERTWGTPEQVAVHAPSRVDDAAFVRWFARFLRACFSPSASSALVRWSTALDVRAVLPAIHAPTLVMSRQDCLMTSSEQGRYVADGIGGARFIELPGRDYLFFTENADQLLDHISEFLTGHQPAKEPDRALKTVMFTDIVGSTESAARLGDRRWTQVLDQHDAILMRELERHGGRKVNPTGDGLLATFDGPARAVRCALAARDAMGDLGLRLRAGVHTGEVELRGDDVGGIAVHIGQRVSALAPAGQVFVSRTVADLVLGSGLGLEDRGEHELKGVPGMWRLFSATG